MKKLKVMTVVGTRPELIRLSRLIPLMDKHTDQVLVHTGQNYDYELNQLFFNDLELREPDHFLDAAGKTASETIAQVISSVDELIAAERPDALLVLGDTNSSLAVLPAKRRKVPIFHMEAGNRCFDERVPEEINRRIVDHTSDINLTYSVHARENLLREGRPSDRTIVSGSPMKEVLSHFTPEIEASTALEDLSITKDKYILASVHREENVDSEVNLRKILLIFNEVSAHWNMPVIVSTHPRTRERLKAFPDLSKTNVRFMKPFGFVDYIQLQRNAFCVLSDSGTITEESSILNFPAVNLREQHERLEGFDEAAVMFAGLDLDAVMSAISVASEQGRQDTRSLSIVRDYNVDNFSLKVLRIILSYTGYVNRTVWKKQ